MILPLLLDHVVKRKYMPKLLQINVTSNWGSTGRISEQCNQYAARKGWDVYAVYGRYSNPSKSKLIKTNTKWDVYEHYVESILLDNEGLASRSSTHRLIERIRSINPDIIHLHNIHDHWLNYKELFEFLNKTDIKVVWTFHDFWAITGHCHHFVQADCNRFMTECYDCPYTKGKLFPLLKRTERNFNLKKHLISANKNLTIVPVSEWVGDNVKRSFLKNKDIHVIPNGVDTGIFKPTEPSEIQKVSESFKRLQGKFVIMAVSSQWKSGSKGLGDYRAMAKMLKKDEVIVLVGVDDKVIATLPANMIGIKRTNNQQELAALYTRADVVCSFSSAETFGLTIVEGYACGTPAVVYDNTAPPTLITSKTGFVAPNHNYATAYTQIEQIRKNGKSHYFDACIALAREKYDKEKCFEKYIGLYEKLLNGK